jgi:TDG/mug DNA glycosylase family protein
MTLPRQSDEADLLSAPPFCGLAPVIGINPAVIILGSYPSLTSLSRGEYYAQPLNRFWGVMEVLLGIAADQPYERRIGSLKTAHIALWDVIGTCERVGSSDASISNPVPNDIAGLLDTHPSIRMVALNGSTGAGRWLNLLFPNVRGRDGLTVRVLPSTSAANARYRLPDLVGAWQTITRFLPGD